MRFSARIQKVTKLGLVCITGLGVAVAAVAQQEQSQDQGQEEQAKEFNESPIQFSHMKGLEYKGKLHQKQVNASDTTIYYFWLPKTLHATYSRLSNDLSKENGWISKEFKTLATFSNPAKYSRFNSERVSVMIFPGKATPGMADSKAPIQVSSGSPNSDASTNGEVWSTIEVVRQMPKRSVGQPTKWTGGH